MSSGGGHNLGFRIEKWTNFAEPVDDCEIYEVIRVNGRTRIATDEEVAMWPLVQAGNEVAEAAAECVDHVAAVCHCEWSDDDFGSIIRARSDCEVHGGHGRVARLRDALAAFRAAKEEQR